MSAFGVPFNTNPEELDELVEDELELLEVLLELVEELEELAMIPEPELVLLEEELLLELEEELLLELEDELLLDVDELEETAKKCDVSAMPTFQVYVNGKKVAELLGAAESELRAMITKWAKAD